ncbi:growth hormone secretagogue receptor type 1-like [Littorina saxatilis]|uniref:growth hormone secretagogue receptor type 1-like n=1 Tax=Littorina saxatilis TaxID=31220 RepID=UPI0038B6081A
MENYQTELMQFPEYRALKNLMLYVPPVLIVLGTFGNVFTFIIMRRRAMLKVSSYHYLAILAVTDSLVLYIGLLRLWLGEVTGTAFHNNADWICKLTISLGYTASDLSVWLIIAVTVERYIVVCFPLRASAMINTNRAKKVIGFLVLLMFTINLHFFWTVEIVERPVDGKNVSNCEAAPHHQQLVIDVWPWVDACIYSFVPFIVILVLNILIICEVVDARNQRRIMQNTPEHGHYQHARLRCGEGTKLTIMLLTVSFTFLLTTLPMNVSLIVTAFWKPYDKNFMRQIVQFKLANTVAELLMYVNHSINFFLYCATGNKFRQQIAYMLHCKTDTQYGPWTSVQTEDVKIHASVKNGHNHLVSKQRLLLSHAVEEDDNAVNGEVIPLRSL